MLMQAYIALVLSLSGCWISTKNPESVLGIVLMLSGQILGAITLFCIVRFS